MPNQSKLTPAVLRKMIAEEKKKMSSSDTISSDAKKDAWAGGSNLVQKVDYIKALDIKEAALKKKLKLIEGAKKILKQQIIKEL
tara:strand:+ start:772 stop:1023 length:252 start_codon:yes stop_codon:yes gene_type:complete